MVPGPDRLVHVTSSGARYGTKHVMPAGWNREQTTRARAISLPAVTMLIPRAGESGTTDKAAVTHRFHHRQNSATNSASSRVSQMARQQDLKVAPKLFDLRRLLNQGEAYSRFPDPEGPPVLRHYNAFPSRDESLSCHFHFSLSRICSGMSGQGQTARVPGPGCRQILGQRRRAEGRSHRRCKGCR